MGLLYRITVSTITESVHLARGGPFFEILPLRFDPGIMPKKLARWPSEGNLSTSRMKLEIREEELTGPILLADDFHGFGHAIDEALTGADSLFERVLTQTLDV
jgi:hypothetical protein